MEAVPAFVPDEGDPLLVVIHCAAMRRAVVEALAVTELSAPSLCSDMLDILRNHPTPPANNNVIIGWTPDRLLGEKHVGTLSLFINRG